MSSTAIRRDAPSTFVVERYWPTADESRTDAFLEHVRTAIDASRRAGRQVRYLGTLVVPDDELLWSLVTAMSLDDVRAASELANGPFERIVRARTVGFGRPDEAAINANEDSGGG